MKKINFSLVVAGITLSSLSASAAVFTGAAPFQIVVPNLKSGLELTLEGLYIKPSNSDLVYANTTSGTSTNINIYQNAVKPAYNFGFGVGLGYVFPNSGNDVQVKWTHFNHDTSNTINLNPVPAGTVANRSSNASFKQEAMDLDVGQYMSIGTRLQTRLFAGLRGVQLGNDVTMNQVVTDQEQSSTIAGTFNSKFTGIGPRVGIDTSYHVGDGFGVAAHLATALLVGQVETGANGVLTTQKGSETLITVASATTDKQTRVVPAFDAKLGVNYSVPFKNNASSMTIEAGYQVTQYVGAIDRVHVASADDLSNATLKTSSVGFSGPYLSLNFKL